MAYEQSSLAPGLKLTHKLINFVNKLTQTPLSELNDESSYSTYTWSMACFPGNETKLGMCRGIAEPKLTAMDAMIDKLTGVIFIF